LYAGSVLLHPAAVGFVPQLVPVNGCVIVEVGHCTRNDCALAATAAKAMMSMEIQTWYDFLMAVQPPHLDPQTAPEADTGCRSSFRG
jgi:hypothetical protein